MLPDVVIPVKDRASEELRWVLRSVAAHLPHGRVWLAGGILPGLVGVEHLPTIQTGSKWENAKGNLRAALDHPDVSDPFLLMNDDMFVMSPVASVPVLHLGPLTEHQQRTERKVGRSQYWAALGRTDTLLREAGVCEPLSYEAHVPMVMTRAGALDALDRCKDDPRLCERSIFGNLTHVGGERIDDVKVYRRADAPPSGPWVSTTEASFARSHAGRHIRGSFPRPCRYEAS